MMSIKKAMFSILAMALPFASANAYVIVFGEDINTSGSAPWYSTVNSFAAEGQFQSQLNGLISSTENFESYAIAPHTQLDVGFAGGVTASFHGDGIHTGIAGESGHPHGRFSIGEGTSRYWRASEGAPVFSISFDLPVLAFGFYGIDVGDFGASLSIQLSNGAIFDIPHTQGSAGSTNGSVFYFGIMAEDESEAFDSIQFISSLGPTSTDYFAFDNMTIAHSHGQQLPEPSSLLLLGLGFLGLRLALRKNGVEA